jgi:hypothetical protein
MHMTDGTPVEDHPILVVQLSDDRCDSKNISSRISAAPLKSGVDAPKSIGGHWMPKSDKMFARSKKQGKNSESRTETWKSKTTELEVLCQHQQFL